MPGGVCIGRDDTGGGEPEGGRSFPPTLIL